MGDIKVAIIGHDAAKGTLQQAVQELMANKGYEKDEILVVNSEAELQQLKADSPELFELEAVVKPSPPTMPIIARQIEEMYQPPPTRQDKRKEQRKGSKKKHGKSRRYGRESS